MTLHEHSMAHMAECGRRLRHNLECAINNPILVALGAEPVEPLPPMPTPTKENPRVYVLDPPEACCPYCACGLVKEVRTYYEDDLIVHSFVHVEPCRRPSKSGLFHDDSW